MTVFLLVLLLTLFVGLCYVGRPYWGWVLGGSVALLALGNLVGWTSVFFLLPILLFAAVATVFGMPGLRRRLLGHHVLRLVGGMLPRMSATEREALEAGTVWWDGDLFSGDPPWRKLLEFHARGLTLREKDFLEGPLRQLLAMLDDHQVARDGDLPPEAWQFIKSSGLMGMIIPVEHGGLGFTARMQSTVITRLSARSVTAAVTVMVPNSLGPAELLLHYGTDEQKRHYLPRLARGEDVPCFALTEPPAGSDAASMRSVGIVCKRRVDGRDVLGMRLTWNKRYITLAPSATVLGLAFKLRDPERLLGGEEELGITCALIPTDTPGVELGRRHDPLGVPFLNGPTTGTDVFVPLDAIIGGPAMAGRGWGMLMQCLSAGRGISLPSLAVGASQLAVRTVGAYATIREQFGLPVGRFEGIEARLGRMGGLTYLIDGARLMTLGAIDAGEKPAVVTAIMKAYTTEAMRVVINDGMDVLGGAGICRGPRNVLAHAYQSVPIGITVEGANILTRSLIIFGQGAIRCHPFVQAEIAAADARDVEAFDEAFYGHVGFIFHNAGRALVLGLTHGALAEVPVHGPALRYYQQLSRLSAAFAFLADIAMGTLGAALKRKENLSGRLADCLAWLYLASGALKRFADQGQPERDVPAMRWALEHALHEVQTAMVGLLQNLPSRPLALLLRAIVLPLGARIRPPSDRLTSEVARALLEGGALRESLSAEIFVPPASEPGLGQIEDALRHVLAARPAQAKLREAQKAGQLAKRLEGAELLTHARNAGILDEREVELLRAAEKARDAAIQVDAFEPAQAFASA